MTNLGAKSRYIQKFENYISVINFYCIMGEKIIFGIMGEKMYITLFDLVYSNVQIGIIAKGKNIVTPNWAK